MGVVLAFALGVVNAHSMIKLVKCSQHLSKKKQLNEDSNRSAVTGIPMTSPSEKTRNTVSAFITALSGHFRKRLGIASFSKWTYKWERRGSRGKARGTQLRQHGRGGICKPES
ncbi:hypothetical protein ANCCAN_15656 [Ancylostoma caninum]|uniref:Uncharacterized protein n=1 Tax=Ancylostoma caninum TaxID=29170 RepID=A0A368G1V8_ANCCA|nr:hypothetical protein ANCCAN_15656 [Ancylostoma caninum]